MGVKGLWKLLDSTGKPIPVEQLENKVLGIDVSIWMYQIIKGVRESELSVTTNKHLTIMFHRICKLLFFGIRPIFVFDGGVPELKKIIIAQRQAQKSYGKKFSGKTKEKMLKNMLEQAALKTVLNPGNTPTEDEVISKTINSLNKRTEIDLFELPKLPESFELDKSKMLTKEKEETYLNSYSKTTENVLLLAVENQDNDILYSNSAKEKKSSSPAKLNAFSSLQIGELLNGFSDDQKRIAERKKQQKAKREMTLNELEMFLNDNNETNGAVIDELSQKIDSDYDTVFYYESDINNTAKKSISKSEVSGSKNTVDSEKNVESELKNKTTNSLATDVIESCTKDIDEDIFKALVGNESLEEDRLAWLTFNENKKASKRRSSEHESPNIKYSKANTNTSNPDYCVVDNDVHTENVLSITHSSKSIFLTEPDLSNESNSNDSEDEDCLSWVSHSQDEPNLSKVKKKESTVDFQNIPSTSKSLSFDEDDCSNKFDKDQQNINNPLLISPKLNQSRENDLVFDVSPSIESDFSDVSFSKNSLDFSTKESSSYDTSDSSTILLDTQNEQEEAVIQNYNGKNKCPALIDQSEFKLNLLDADNTRFKSKFISNSTKSSKPLSGQTSPMKEQDLLLIQDTLVKHQNDLADLKRTYDQMASSVTNKMASDIKSLLRLFGIPYITAPMEAEAQCAFLEKIGCTEGTVTDDSDVWLFGANVVYKDFFDSHKFVKQFRSIDIRQKFALSQDNFIQLAFLVGSDYTDGIDGIGPVSAIEILSFFESKTKHMNIENKLLKIKEIAHSKNEIYSDIPCIKKLRSSRIGNDFPNKAVINAYLKPIVNESNEKFKWDTPQEDLIIQFAQKHFGWDVCKTKSTLAPVLKKVSERTKQKTLDSYVKTLPKLTNTNTGMSKRVSLAVKRLRNDTSSGEIGNQKSESLKNLSSANSSKTIQISKKRRKNCK